MFCRSYGVIVLVVECMGASTVILYGLNLLWVSKIPPQEVLLTYRHHAPTYELWVQTSNLSDDIDLSSRSMLLKIILPPGGNTRHKIELPWEALLTVLGILIHSAWQAWAFISGRPTWQ